MSSVANVVVEQASELTCVLIPTQPEPLLLPNICVAEIVPWRRISQSKELPAWCLGHLGWRGQTIPVVHFAAFDHPEQGKPGGARCLVVMNRSRHAAGPSFYALLASGLPRMVQLLEDDLSNEPSGLGDADIMKVKVGTEVATIPNLAFIEEQLFSLNQTIR